VVSEQRAYTVSWAGTVPGMCPLGTGHHKPAGWFGEVQKESAGAGVAYPESEMRPIPGDGMTARRKKQSKAEQKADAQKIRAHVARLHLTPSQSSANVIHDLTREVEVTGEGIKGCDFVTLAVELEKQNKAVFEGDLRRVEAMLLDQSHVLQSLFVFFTQKMAHAKYMDSLEAYSRIALKAQNQCRQTSATLVELKNPKRATFIKQQNNAVNQQVNQHGENPKNSEYPANKILEEIPSERLDTRTPQAAIGVNQEVEAMGENHRTQDGRREKEG